MDNVKLSSNYQIVVPKAVRKKLGLQKGQRLYVKSVHGKDVTFTAEDPIERYYGLLKGVWTEDPVEYQRRIRGDRELPEL